MSTDGAALAWQRDVESEHAYPMRFARRRLPDAHAAEDAVQDTCWPP